MVHPTEFTLKEVCCEVCVPNIQAVPEEDYALLRRQGLGASDASVYLGLMSKFNKSEETLIAEKMRTNLTDEDREISKKEAVRKGKDLEDLILAKFAKLHGCEKPFKPQHMYRFTDFPFLTTNFDGVLWENEQYVPVECKFVTPFGDKHYDRLLAYKSEFNEKRKERPNPILNLRDIVEYCEAQASKYGIPPYYYAQVQQQMLGLGSSYGYLAALHDKGWELCIYRIPRDEHLIENIQVRGFKVWNKVEKLLRK